LEILSDGFGHLRLYGAGNQVMKTEADAITRVFVAMQGQYSSSIPLYDCL
jgi:hypothetical protein